jgi:hypothetical protein
MDPIETNDSTGQALPVKPGAESTPPTGRAPSAAPKPAAAAPAAAKPGAAPVAAAPAAGIPTPAPAKKNWKEALGAQAKLLEANAKVKELEVKAGAIEALQAKAKTDPLGALAELGLDYTKIAHAFVAKKGIDGTGAAPTAAAAEPKEDLAKKVSELDGKVTAAAKAQEDAAAKAVEEEWNQFAATVDTAVKGDAEKYPTITAFGSSQLVVDEIVGHFEKTQKMMTPGEAAQAVETRLAGELSAFIKNNPKILGVLGLAEVSKQQQEDKPRTPTLARKPPAPARTVSAGVPVSLATGAPTAKRSRAPSAVQTEDESFAEFRRRKYAAST